MENEEAAPASAANAGALLTLRNSDPVGFLRDIGFHSGKSGDTPGNAFGFKIFYEHCWEGRLRDVWDFLEKETAIRIIHLKRISLLHCLASRSIAQETKAYTSLAPTADAARDSCVKIEPRTARLFFERTAVMEREMDFRFRHHQIRTVYYEDMLHNLQGQMDRIQDFLEVPRQPLVTFLKKQNTRGLRDMITNYEELKAAFADSRWRAYFIE